MKTIYKNFAQIYDIFMQDVPYDDWVAYVEQIWQRYNHAPRLVLELACGSGNITQRLHAKGYDMIGLDNASDMLTIATQKAYNLSADILYLLQDMRAFELYGTVDSILCLCDGMNYILEEDELSQIFALARNYLNPGGLFIFDMNTEYKFKQILGDNSFCDMDDTAAYIWENEYDDSEKINAYHMHFFVKSKPGLYKRFAETHLQKAYAAEAIEKRLISAGLKPLGVFHDGTFAPPAADSERIYFVSAAGLS